MAPHFCVGERVEGRYATHPVEGKLDRYYTGVVQKVFCADEGNQTHVDLLYDDGDQGMHVDIKHVRALPSHANESEPPSLAPPANHQAEVTSVSSDEEMEEGAVDWPNEGKTTGHDYINKRVAIWHDTEIARGTITMWAPANDEEGDPALFHVKHDDGDSEDLEEDEVEAAMELLAEEEEKDDSANAAGQRGKRKAVDEMSPKQRGKRKQQPAAAEKDGDEEDDIEIVGSHGDVALADFPHSREYCAKIKFVAGFQQDYCANCYCMVCDSPASTCDEWSAHCHAVYSSKEWQTLRQERREATTGAPKPAAKGKAKAAAAAEVVLPPYIVAAAAPWGGDRLLEAVTQVFPREEAVPPGLVQGIALRPYQKQSLAFMCDVERSKAKSLVGSDGQRGGWLCDEVGMGKTAVTIALILANPSGAKRAPSGHVEKRQPVAYKTTLIVVPSMLVQQWEDEVRRFAPRLKVNVHFDAPAPTQRGGASDYVHEEVVLPFTQLSKAQRKEKDTLTKWMRCDGVYAQAGVYAANAVANAPLIAALEKQVRDTAKPGEINFSSGDPTWQIYSGSAGSSSKGAHPSFLMLTPEEVASFGLSGNERSRLAYSAAGQAAGGGTGYVIIDSLRKVHGHVLLQQFEPLCFRPVPETWYEDVLETDEHGQPVYKAGISLDTKKLSGSSVVIIEDVDRFAAHLVKPNRVLVAINGEFCKDEQTARALILKAKLTPKVPMTLHLRTQTRQAQGGGASARAKKKARRNDAADLRDCDVLITSPKGLARQNFDRDQLAHTRFHRLVVDESHLIGRTHEGEEIRLDYLQAVHADSVWLLTGTPFSASINELSQQAAVLGARPWLDELLRRPASQSTADALRERMIRHTKSQRIDGEVALALPKASFRIQWLDLTAGERAAYECHACMESSSQADQSRNAEAQHNVRKLLEALEPRFEAQSLALCGHYTAAGVQAPQQTATKLSWLQAELRALLASEPNMRIAIFTHNDAVQSGLVNWLSALGKGVWAVDDLKQSLKATEKQRILQCFQSKDVKGARLFVATFRVAAVGLNLHHATRVYLLEPTFDPAVAVQAAGRVHRLGQSKEVKIVQLAYRNTLDETLLAVHDQVRDGTLRLERGLLPRTVDAMLNAHRAEHSLERCDNGAQRSALRRDASNALSLHARGRAEEEVPLKCEYPQCTSCGHIKWSDAVYELMVMDKHIQYSYAGGPNVPPTKSKVIAQVYPNGRSHNQSLVSVCMPITAAVGDVFTFRYVHGTHSAVPGSVHKKQPSSGAGSSSESDATVKRNK